MTKNVCYAHLKTIDGEEVTEYSKEACEKLLEQLKTRKVEKTDRVLYFVEENKKAGDINFFKSDYFEVLN